MSRQVARLFIGPGVKKTENGSLLIGTNHHRYHLRVFTFLLPIILVCVSTLAMFGTVHAAQTWDLTADWSDTNNQNGPWSFNDGPSGTAVTTHWDNWDPQHCCFTDIQPAWSVAQWPGYEHEIVWFKTVSPVIYPAVVDMPIGTMGTHGTSELPQKF